MPDEPDRWSTRATRYLAADQARFGGANQAELWAAFARRGLGQFAFSDQRHRPRGRRRVRHRTRCRTSRRRAAQRDGDVRGRRRRDAAQTPRSRRAIYVGHYEARVSPIADTDPATNAPATATREQPRRDGDVRARARTSSSRPRPATARCASARTFRAGTTQTVTLRHGARTARRRRRARRRPATPRRVMSRRRADGADRARRCCDHLIDDTEATRLAGRRDAGRRRRWNVDGSQVTIDLAGTTPAADQPRAGRARMLGPVFDPAARADQTQNRFTALRQFEIWTCNDPVADCSTDDGYQRALRERGATRSRPTRRARWRRSLLLREFTFSPVQATHLRIVVAHEPVHRRPGVPGRAGRRPVQRDRLQHGGPGRDAVRARRRAAGVRAGRRRCRSAAAEDRSAGAGERRELERGAAAAAPDGDGLDAAARSGAAERDGERAGARCAGAAARVARRRSA